MQGHQTKRDKRQCSTCGFWFVSCMVSCVTGRTIPLLSALIFCDLGQESIVPVLLLTGFGCLHRVRVLLWYVVMRNYKYLYMSW